MTRTINQFKTAVLLAGLFALVLFVGQLVGGTAGLQVAFVIGLVINGGVFFFSDTLALKAMRAQQVTAREAPGLVAIVERLADRAGLPMPAVYVCPQATPNAFATGRSPRHAAVAVTHGALQLLNERELEGVMAHELAHVKNRDTLISTVAATIAGVLSYVQWMFLLGGGNRGVHPLAQLALVILAPVAAAVVQAAVSRSREFVADHDGAVIAGTPDGLVSALQKLDAYGRGLPMPAENAAQSHLFIVPPVNAGVGRDVARLFSTHPPTERRIAKLRGMGDAMTLRAA